MTEKINWLVGPKGTTENDAILVCIKLMRHVFGLAPSPNEPMDKRWKKSGLKAMQDPNSPYKWGVVCYNQDFANQVHDKISDKLWNGDGLQFHLEKYQNLGKIKGNWKGYEYNYNLTYPTVAKGKEYFAKVQAFVYINDQKVNSDKNTKPCDFVIHWYSILDSKEKKIDPPLLIWSHSDKGLFIPIRFNEDNYDALVRILTKETFKGRKNLRNDLKIVLNKTNRQSSQFETGLKMEAQVG